MPKLFKNKGTKGRHSNEGVRGSNLDYPADKTIMDLFIEQVKRTPDKIAVAFKDSQLTYLELDRRSNQFADYLIQSHGIVGGDLVGIKLDRSEWLIVCILGTLKSGAAYVPMDPGYPQQRIDYIKNDSRCKVTIDHSLLEDFHLDRDSFSARAPLKVDLRPDSLSYIIYTSGTTGDPKGVMIEHRNVVRLFFNKTPLFDFNEKDVWSMFHSFCFDFSIWEMFGALLFGGKLIVVPASIVKDSFEFMSLILREGITVLNQTPSSFMNLMSSADESKINTKLRYVIFGGEALYPKCLEKWYRQFPDIKFINMYGITETTVHVTYKEIGESDIQKNISNIGNYIPTLSAYILNDLGKLRPKGVTGELYVSGAGLARGYLNRPKLTAEKFVTNPFVPGERMYRTGDLARWLPNGDIEFIGRKDDQVKIRGHRIELGEIEAALNTLSNIKRATVLLSDHLKGEPRLVAYLQAMDNDNDTNAVRSQLKEILPDFSMPSFIMWVKDFPITPNGKIDNARLPRPEYVRPDSAPLFRKPRTELEKNIVEIWSEHLQVSDIGVDDNFFELGGTSLLTQKVATAIRQDLKIEVPVTKIYQYPTVSKLSGYLSKGQKTLGSSDVVGSKKRKPSDSVAVIGMAGRFPGARSVQELWEVLKDGRETTSFFTSEELDAGIPESLRNDSEYVKARGIVPSAQTFDAAFFGLNPKIAEAMDPQQRLFLEIAWEALEQSGHLPRHYKGSIGVYAGTGTNTYYKNNVLPNKDLLDQVGHLPADTINEKDYIASRTAYHLNLKGPAVSVHSACSTSLLAVAEAVEAIRNGQCNIALAGGSSVTAPMYSGHLYQEGSMLSADGHCRSFDAEGTGTVFSDGAGIVLLKSLEAAQNDGDMIYGVIKGVGINNDGGNKGSFTAPSAEGQAGAITKALQDANVPPSSITYVEAHGTATPLGDPIEMEGLRIAFGEQERIGYCALGSIKSNIGHLTAAAGVAGLIKTLLAMNHLQIPASLGFKKPNPAIDFENSPFFVNQELRDWDTDRVRLAGVSSFGVGGTNVHVIVEEHVMKERPSRHGRPFQILPWSAKTETSLEGYANALEKHLQDSSSASLSDVAYSLSVTRDSFSHRRFVLAGTLSDALKELKSQENKINTKTILRVAPDELAFLFPGQGAQYQQMGRALYEDEKVYRKAVDTCAELLMEHLDLDIRKLLFPDTQITKAEAQLQDTRYTQPALFVTEYALSQLWISWGIKPTLLCGHSIGEFVAAHLAGVFTLSDALHLIATRGRLVSELPRGSMLSVRLTADRLQELLPDNLSIAAINSERSCVLSGACTDIKDFIQKLDEHDIPHRPLSTSHAFHSVMMDPILETFGDEVRQLQLNVPSLPIVSTVTGTWLTDEEATDPKYWTDHLRATVRFSDAMDTVLSIEDPILLEVGPGQTLTSLARQKKAGKSSSCIASLPVPKNDSGAYPALLNALGQLWLKGVEPDWHAFYAEQLRQKVSLPAYVFDRKPCWVKPLTTVPFIPSPTPVLPTGKLSTNKNRIMPMRKTVLLEKISEIITNTSGIDLETADYGRNFLELGLDSLILTQMAISCKREFDIPITFRQLNEQFGTPELLATHLDQTLAPELYAPAPINIPVPSSVGSNSSQPENRNTTLEAIAQQIQLLGRQIDVLRNNGTIAEPAKGNDYATVPRSSTSTLKSDILTEEEKSEHKKPFGAAPRIERQSSELSDKQQKFLKELIRRYNKKTAGSKKYAQEHRAQMADPRVVSGFKPLTKELTYPLVIEKSSGSRLWDVDGNEYLDALNGFGSCLFGHQPDFITEALKNQIELGYEVGPQHPLAGEVCNLLCEFTDHDRAALCNTGSEAVLGAMRIARTVTGRSLIVTFSTSYHGINDEAIVRGSSKMKTFPAAAGIQPEAVQNMLVLEYGTDESLNIIRERAHELAAVLVEPVQSRRPEFRPVEFLHAVREITTEAKTALIFDEIITGFRIHPGGTQALFGIKADIATYGKVIGGGLPIGAICGKKEYMDALDGGFWRYGDDSFPEIGVTYFAGTFVRHPLALASCKASLRHMAEKGKILQDVLADLTEGLATTLNSEFTKRKLPMHITSFGSIWRIKFREDIPYSELLFVLLREKGIHIWDGFPCFLTTAYTKDDITRLIDTVLTSTDELVAAGFFSLEPANIVSTISPTGKKSSKILNTPPMPGARLGRDESGNPSWFVRDAKKEGEYVKIDL